MLECFGDIMHIAAPLVFEKRFANFNVCGKMLHIFY